MKKVNKMPSNTKGQLFIALMAIFFAMPIVVVILMYKYDWHPKSFSYGELIKPVIKINVTDLLNQESHKIRELENRNLFDERWSFVYLTDECLSTCENKLYELRQIHASLEKDIPRVQRVLITIDTNTNKIYEKYPDLIILSKPKAEIEKLASQFDLPHFKAMNSDNVYLIDPLSNLMMVYNNRIKPNEIRKDIARLLKYAWTG